MNKLMGFYELTEMNVPSIPWKEYTGNDVLDNNNLWTIRSAVFSGNDLNLPRLVGGTALEARTFADNLHTRMRGTGIVVYYPYFLANKSGTLKVENDTITIEAVKEDLWNLVTHGSRDVTITISQSETYINGNDAFLTKDEIDRIVNCVPVIRRAFRDEMIEGKSVLLEWSLAQKSDTEKKPIGEEFLVFYEARTT